MNYQTYLSQIERLKKRFGHYQFPGHKVSAIWTAVKNMNEQNFMEAVGRMVAGMHCPTVQSFERLANEHQKAKFETEIKKAGLQVNPVTGQQPATQTTPAKQADPSWPDGSKERALAKDPQLQKLLDEIMKKGRSA